MKQNTVIASVLMAVLVFLGGCGGTAEPEPVTPVETTTVAVEPTEEPTEEPTAEPTPEVPSEYQAALTKAQMYVDTMPFSELGLYDQLTSEFGEQFSPEAAQYALENVRVDYNIEALEAAMVYSTDLAMSPEAIRDQLVSPAGNKFTDEQAAYAIENLP